MPNQERQTVVRALREKMIAGGDIGPLLLWLRLEVISQQKLMDGATDARAQDWYQQQRDNFETTIEVLQQRCTALQATQERVGELEEAEADLRSLHCELATLLGPRKPRSGASTNEQWIAAVGEVLGERDHLQQAVDEAVAEFERKGRHHANTARRLELEGRGEFNGGDLGAERANFEAAAYLRDHAASTQQLPKEQSRDIGGER